MAFENLESSWRQAEAALTILWMSKWEIKSYKPVSGHRAGEASGGIRTQPCQPTDPPPSAGGEESGHEYWRRRQSHTGVM